MKLTKSLMTVTLAGTLWAQTPSKTPDQMTPKTPAKTPAQMTTKTPASTPAQMTAKAPVKPATTAPTAAKTAAKPVTPAKPAAIAAKKPVVPVKAPARTLVGQETAMPSKKPVTKAAVSPEKVVKPASAKAEEASRVAPRGLGKRDPFVSPIVRQTGGTGPACETGKRCLMVDQIQLKGIVKSPNGFIAVVENAAKRAYFLRENDPVFNGSVMKITGDTVVFREQQTDKLGKQSTREVVKKVNAPVV